jgi:hypothetical protein
MIMNALKLLWEPMTFVMLVLFMVLIPKYLLTILRLLPFIIMFPRRIETSTMRLIKILLVVLQLELDRILPELYLEKTHFPPKVKEHLIYIYIY